MWLTSSLPVCFGRIGKPLLLLIAIPLCSIASGQSQQSEVGRNTKGVRPITRILWQDDSDLSICWSDLTRVPMGYEIKTQKTDGFPKLNPEKQSLTQMEGAHGLVVIGVHDEEEGAFQSGWVALNTGVREEVHGDHSHWHYPSPPTVIASKLSNDQGNPSHLYQFQGYIYLANDKKNGFTIIPALEMLKSPSPSLTRFVSGGGNHITLAVVDRKVGYATWSDRDGENQGRVDVVPIDKSLKRMGYQLKMPQGSLHGAIANSGRLFFASSDGICWVDADSQLTKKPDRVDIHLLSLGNDPVSGNPLRTGAFTNQEHFVLFTTGSQEGACLCMVDAKATKPIVVKLPVPIAPGLNLTLPKCTKTASGKSYAFLFSDRRGSEAEESLIVVDLDPNGDGHFADAKIAKTIPVGPSKIAGHSGHHDVCFSPNRRLACITNPGEGSIWVISLSDLQIESRNKVQGAPSRILAFGG